MDRPQQWRCETDSDRSESCGGVIVQLQAIRSVKSQHEPVHVCVRRRCLRSIVLALPAQNRGTT